jgi:hypothetical protein
VLQRPRQHSFLEFGDLLAVLHDDRILADEIIRLMWLSRLTRMHGQFSRAATFRMCVDLPVPW